MVMRLELNSVDDEPIIAERLALSRNRVCSTESRSG